MYVFIHTITCKSVGSGCWLLLFIYLHKILYENQCQKNVKPTDMYFGGCQKHQAVVGSHRNTMEWNRVPSNRVRQKTKEIRAIQCRVFTNTGFSIFVGFLLWSPLRWDDGGGLTWGDKRSRKQEIDAKSFSIQETRHSPVLFDRINWNGNNGRQWSWRRDSPAFWARKL